MPTQGIEVESDVGDGDSSSPEKQQQPPARRRRRSVTELEVKDGRVVVASTSPETQHGQQGQEQQQQEEQRPARRRRRSVTGLEVKDGRVVAAAQTPSGSGPGSNGGGPYEVTTAAFCNQLGAGQSAEAPF